VEKETHIQGGVGINPHPGLEFENDPHPGLPPGGKGLWIRVLK